VANAQPDPEALLDRLFAAGVLAETADGTLTTTPEFEETRSVYHDTYADVSEEEFRATLVELFDLDPEEAAAEIEEQGVTREELVAFLSLRSFLADPPDELTLAMLARMTTRAAPASPVPTALRELDDDDYRTFLDEHPDAFLTVWKNGCAPCEAMKEDFGAILEALPDAVAAAGVDGGTVSAFRREFEVDAAPAVLLFRDGDLVQSDTGRQSVAAMEERFAAVYGD
jgi:thiol-disulfide isomerase/thioredoxin